MSRETPEDGGKASPESSRAPQLLWLSDVEPQEVRWLWKPYIPLGKLTLLEGDPGIGKSWIIQALAAAISSGRALPGGVALDPADVVLLSAEDDLADTIRPRLDSLEADCSRIVALQDLRTFDNGGLADLEAVLRETRPKLLTIDPLVFYMGPSVDLYRANETRGLLAELARISADLELGTLMLRHLGKGPKDKAIYRGLGSIDIAAACRSILMAGVDPRDMSRRGIVHLKCNNAPEGGGIGYSISEGKFRWTGPSDLTAELMHSATKGPRPIDRAKEFLFEVLAERESPATEVEEEAFRRGITGRTLRRAAAEIGVASNRHGETGRRGGGQWSWALPCRGNDGQAREEQHLATLIDPDAAPAGH